MKKKCTYLIILFFIFYSNSSFAQITAYEKSIGTIQNDGAHCIVLTNDGNYIVGGYIDPDGFNTFNFFLMKMTQEGDTIWTKIYEDAGYPESHITNIVQTADSGYACMGYVYHGNIDIYLFRTDKLGNLLWTKQYGGNREDLATGFCETFDKGFVLAGYTKSYGPNPANQNWLIIRTDENGDTLWTKIFGTDTVDIATVVLETPDSGLIIGGDTWGFGAGEGDIVLMKTDKDGNISWVKTFGGAYDDYLYNMSSTKDGGYILAGNTESWLGGVVSGITEHNSHGTIQDDYIIRLDANYDTVWTRTYGGGHDGILKLEAPFAVKETMDGNFIIGGSSGTFGVQRSAYYLKLNYMGDTIWTRLFDGSSYDVIQSIEIAPDDNPILVGYTNSNLTLGKEDAFILKTDINGNSGCNTFYSPTVVGNTFTEIGTTNLFQTSSGINMDTVPMYMRVGDVVSINKICECFIPISISALIDTLCMGDSITLTAISTGNDFLWNTGETTASITVSPTDTTTYSVTVSNDTCASEKSFTLNVVTCVGVKDKSVNEIEVKIFPNPFNQQAELRIKNPEYLKEKLEIKIYDIIGREMQYSKIQNNFMEIKRGNLPGGIYFYKITSNKIPFSNGKLIIVD